MADENEGNDGAVAVPKAPIIKIVGFEQAAKAAGYFSWNDETNHCLAKYAKKHSAYFVSDISMEIKWKCVKADILTHDLFKYLSGDISWKGLKQQFERSKKQVLDRCAISKEGANLSGRSKPTELEEFMVCIEKHLASKKRSRDEKSLKEHEQDVLLEDIAQGGLKKQGKLLKTTNSAAKTVRTSSEESDLTNEEEKENATCSTNVFNPKNFFFDIKNDISKIMGDGGGEDVREKELRIELLKEQLDNARLDKELKTAQLKKLQELL